MPAQITPTTSIRTAAIDRLLELIQRQDGLDEVQVCDGYPVDLRDECIFAGDLTGDLTVPVIAAGTVRRDDKFVLALHFMAARPGQQEARDARRRCEVLVATVEAMLRLNPGLDNLSTLPFTALEVGLDGPDPEPSGEGWVAFATLRIQITARIK